MRSARMRHFMTMGVRTRKDLRVSETRRMASMAASAERRGRERQERGGKGEWAVGDGGWRSRYV